MKTTITNQDLALVYCDRQGSKPEELFAKLFELATSVHPTGFLLLECNDRGSAACGTLAVLPYGGLAKLQAIPVRPVELPEPYEVIAYMPTCALMAPPDVAVEDLIEERHRSGKEIVLAGNCLEAYNRELAMKVVCQRRADEAEVPVRLLRLFKQPDFVFAPRRTSIKSK